MIHGNDMTLFLDADFKPDIQGNDALQFSGFFILEGKSELCKGVRKRLKRVFG